MNMLKQVIIEVPLDAEIPNLDSFNLDERVEILKMGYEYVLRVRKYAVGEKKIRELRDEVRGEYEETICKMDKELDEMRIIEKYLMRTGEERSRYK